MRPLHNEPHRQPHRMSHPSSFPPFLSRTFAPSKCTLRHRLDHRLYERNLVLRQPGDDGSLNTVPAASRCAGAGKRGCCYHATRRDAAGTVMGQFAMIIPNSATIPKIKPAVQTLRTMFAELQTRCGVLILPNDAKPEIRNPSEVLFIIPLHTFAQDRQVRNDQFAQPLLEVRRKKRPVERLSEMRRHARRHAPHRTRELHGPASLSNK